LYDMNITRGFVNNGRVPRSRVASVFCVFGMLLRHVVALGPHNISEGWHGQTLSGQD
jgi:hypothetical protein